MLYIMEVTVEDRRVLERLARSEVEPYRKVAQARGLLMLSVSMWIRRSGR